MRFDQFLASQVMMQGFDRVEIEMTLGAAERLEVSRRRFGPREVMMVRGGVANQVGNVGAESGTKAARYCHAINTQRNIHVIDLRSISWR